MPDSEIRQEGEKIARQLAADLGDRVETKVASPSEILALPEFPEDGDASDHQWCIGYEMGQEQWMVLVRGFQDRGKPAIIARCDSRGAAIYISQLHNTVLKNVRGKGAEPEEAEEASPPRDVTGEGAGIEPLPMAHGEHSVQTPWPRMARKDV
jgi:hypothetical protein